MQLPPHREGLAASPLPAERAAHVLHALQNSCATIKEIMLRRQNYITAYCGLLYGC